MVDIRMTQGLVRFYEEGGYETKSPYSAVCSITVIDEEVYIIGLHGKFHPRYRTALLEKIAALGYATIHFERAGKWKTHTLTDGKWKQIDRKLGREV